jgi:hypothetical protein
VITYICPICQKKDARIRSICQHRCRVLGHPQSTLLGPIQPPSQPLLPSWFINWNDIPPMPQEEAIVIDEIEKIVENIEPNKENPIIIASSNQRIYDAYIIDDQEVDLIDLNDNPIIKPSILIPIEEV